MSQKPISSDNFAHDVQMKTAVLATALSEAAEALGAPKDDVQFRLSQAVVYGAAYILEEIATADVEVG